MKTNRFLLSCAVVALSSSALLHYKPALAQISDMDFMAPPVVDNVGEIQMPTVDEAMDASAGASSEIMEEQISSTPPLMGLEPTPFNLDVSEFDASSIPAPDQVLSLGDSMPDMPVEEMTVISPPQPEINLPQDMDYMPDFSGIGSEISATMPSFEDSAVDAMPPAAVVDTVAAMPPPEPVLNVGKIIDPMAAALPELPEVPGIASAKSIPAPAQSLSGESKGRVEADADYNVSDKYYSSDRGVTTSDLNAPVKADPVKDPARRIVIIDRISGAGDLDARFVAAQRALDLRRYESALHMFEGLYKGNKRDQRVLMGRAVALQMTGQEEKAVQAYEELLDLSPKNPKVLVNLLGLISQQYPTVALERLGALYERFPGNAAIAAQMGLAEAGLNNYDSALRFIGIATSLEPGNAQHYFNLAVVYDHNREYKKAIAQYERSLEIDSMSRQGTIKRDVIYDRLSRLRQM
jgi:Tfp pilus assembly protein PilF